MGGTASLASIIALQVITLPPKMAETAVSVPIPRVRSKKVVFVAIGLAILAVTPVVTYYYMSFKSVNGTVIQVTSASRNVLFSSFRTSVTFFIEVHVWSGGTSIDARVSNPEFSLAVDSYPIQTVAAGSGTFKPYGYLIYNLKFATSDGTVANAVGQTAANQVSLSMDALVSAGLYQEQVTVRDSTRWIW